MSLGKKIIALFLILGISFSIGNVMALKLAVLPTFEGFERDSAEETLSRVMDALGSDRKALEVYISEWSSWDHTYAYVQGKRPEYVDENLDNPKYWHSVNIDLILIVDSEGNQLYGRLGDPSDGKNLPLADELLQPLLPGHPLVSHDTESQGKHGLFQTYSGVLQVVSNPILTTAGSGPDVGSFVIGRFLDEKRVSELGNRVTTELSISPVNGRNALLSSSAATQQLLESGEDTLWTFTSRSARASVLLRDIGGEPAALLDMSVPSKITQIGVSTIQTASMLLAAASAIFLFAAWLFMRRLIVTPVKSLTETILNIRRSGDLQVAVEAADRSDEVGVLAREFSEMALKLSHSKKELEAARDEAVAMSKTKGEFLARMSHEIRTPMNGVLGMTELLRDTSLDVRQKRFTDTIYESAGSLLNIINDILDFSKMEAGKLRLAMIDVDLRNLLEETVDSLANQAYSKGIELINIVPPNLHRSVVVDPVRLRQVLTNLVSNAIKFTEEGEVVLKVSAMDVDDDQVSVHFEIKDTGIGIKPEKQEMIFNSFMQEDETTTRLYGGTGLGLAISRQIVQLMGSELKVASIPGKGSTFSFTLISKKGGEPDDARFEQPYHMARKNVLIVDDNATNRKILEHQLKSWRAVPVCASSADQAIEILEAAVASGDLYDLAILDMHMPRTDGLGLARAIRNNPSLAELKLIILSSVATPTSEELLQELGISGQLTKPIRQSQLYDSLVVALSGDMMVQSHSKLKIAKAKRLSGRVLLAEDNAVNQAVAIGMLEAMGLTVVVATNGEEAIEKAMAETFDVIIMDCQMPIMDGFTATKAIRDLEVDTGRLRTPIIAATANALKGDREQCLAAGMDEYLTKPFTGEQLHSVVAPFLQTESVEKIGARPTETEIRESDTTTQMAESPLDQRILESLFALQTPGAPNLVQKVMKIYLENSTELKANLRVAIDTSNAVLLRQSAHALNSMSANVGAIDLASICKHLETMGREDNLSDAPTVFQRFEREYARVVAALRFEAGAVTT